MPAVEEIYLQRCLDLAIQGAGNVAPNPMVGCVIVHENRIIGEGFHKQFGEYHAEVNAINSVKEEDQKYLPESVLYVNLEPCSHHGKTPPCADLIIETKIPRIVIGCSDPNPLVAGRGIGKLKNNGCDVQTGVLHEESRMVNRIFFTFFEKKRPYIILKWAQSSDGFIAPENRQRINISNPFSRILTHKWRSEEAAIMVGTGTALQDDPMLNARLWNNRNPIRLVIDRTLRLPSSLHLFDHSIPTFVFTGIQKPDEHNLSFIDFDFGKNLLQQILEWLYNRQITSLIVEGGTALFKTFIDNNLWDEGRIFIASEFMGTGLSAPKLKPAFYGEESIGDDRLLILYNG
ncbi:MAG: bifunctional diaminohydroxyphosphoribosylaminopyrimidine deaminase/5-amino-6-(5-phosphoribosylamino)uracil reductase RibD [Chitinophagales bacterium]|nr:bifunctional diaminohydroxyphosphoribosylaminopyrimidine deaminase/5-amino-6-(5-phosphoribosylamino)uracil reductase RibD [Chitinophagales bacterium]